MHVRSQRESIRGFIATSGRMQAAFVVVRCPLTPYDSDPWKSSRAHPTAWDGITPMWPAYEPVATSLQE